MATATTNTILTQIALKRLSGKALTSGKQSLPQEPFGSTVQSSTTTIFGQVVPNTANTNESDLFYIQSASAADPGTVQLVDFDLIPLSNGKYQNVTDVDNDTEESGYNADTGVTTVDTFHAYMLRLTGSYEADTNAIGATYFADNASTDKVLGTAPEYSDNFIASASVQFQVVPEYLSTEVGSANPYAPKVIASDGSSEIAFTDSARNMYFDAFSGILFVQDPVDYGTTTSGVDGFDAKSSAATIPGTLRAFLYVGKYQSEIAGDDIPTNPDLFFHGNDAGGGFNVDAQTTSSFVSGSGDGLLVSASADQTITFTLNNVISGSQQITDLGGFHISASEGTGFDVDFNNTASFVSGTAGITVTAGATNTITIGDASDDVTFGNVTTTGNVVAEGDVIARNYIVSSSITYMTQSFSEGSTIFGDTNNDTHLFTGSVNIFKTGSGFALTLETAQSGTITPASGLKITTNATSSFGTAIEATGSVSLTGSTFTWNRPSGNSSQIPLVYDATTGNIHTGSQYSTTTGTFNSFKIRANGDDSTEQGITDGNTIEFNTGSGQGINIVASDTDTLTFTVGNGVVSSSAQLSDTFLEINGDNVISSSAQLTGSFLEIYGDNVFSSSQQLPAGIISSSNLFHITVGTGETTGELISIGDTASFAASGTGLSVTYLTASNTIQYTVDPDTLVGGTTDSTTFNFTASNAVSASHAINANNAAKVILVDEENTDSDRAIVFADPATGASTLKTDNTTFRYNSADAKVLIGDTAAIITIDGQNNIVQAGTHATASILNSVVEIMDIGGAATTLNIGASTGTATIKNATINLGESLTDIVNIKGTASIDGNLIVKGQTTAIDTVNLVVEDAFIHLASGSGTSGNGGIIVERATDNTGTALFWDETNDVWAVDVSQSDAYSNSATTDAKVAFVSHSAGLPGTAFNADVVVGATDDYKKGQLYVDTSDDYGLYVYL